MPTYKLNIFVNAVILRYNAGEGTIDAILVTYTKLTETEKGEIKTAIGTRFPNIPLEEGENG